MRYKHVMLRRSARYWLISGENLKAIETIMRPVHEQAAQMTDEEINAAIDEALDEVTGH